MHLPTCLHKHKAVHEHAMAAYGVGIDVYSTHSWGGGASVILTPRPLYHHYRNPIPTDKNAVWTPEPVGNFGEEKSLPPAGIRTPDRPARSLITTLTELTPVILIVRQAQ
jgi:hypothetical protein